MHQQTRGRLAPTILCLCICSALALAAPKHGDGARVKAHQDRQPKGLPGVNLTPEQVNRAIDRGAEFLWNYLKKEDIRDRRPLGEGETHILCALALVHAGAHKKFPEFDSQLRGLLSSVNYAQRDGHQTYQAGLLAMLVESYGDATYLPKLELATRYLLEAQGKQGSWDYSTDVPKELLSKKLDADPRVLQVAGGVALDVPVEVKPWTRITAWEKGEDGDNSNTQYAMLGLNAAARSGVKLPAETWQRSLKVHLDREADGGGFGYNGGTPYGSMTCAGICAVAIAQHWLDKPKPEEDPAVERGLAWLEKNFSVSEHPNSNQWHYYYLYSLERVGRILDTEFVGQHEWYPLGARWLVDAQKPDGSWVGESPEDDPRLATSFALLFLTRATPTLNVQEKRGGDGMLLTNWTAPNAGRIYVILDCSGSMLDEMGGRAKFDIAREAVQSLVKDLPETSEVALRVYGSRKRAIEADADADTQLLAPLEPLNRAKMLQTLGGLRARGKTPLAQSLEEAAKDLANEKPAVDGATDDQSITVLLLTDGGEDTRPRKDPVKAAAELAKLKHVRLQIVGFDINREDWSEQLRAMAAAAGGSYVSAADAQHLVKDLRNTVLPAPDAFKVVDAAGASVVTGKFGDRVKLHEGKYTLHTSFDGQPIEQEFWINTDRSTSMTFNAANLPKGVADPARTSAPADATKKCAKCGAPLAPGAKFCTNCGEKVE